VHHPVGLIGLAVLAEVGVEHQDLLAPTLLAGDHHRPRLAGLVPPRLAPLLLLLLLRGQGGGRRGLRGPRLNLTALASAGGVSLGRPVEKVPAPAVLCQTCMHDHGYRWMSACACMNM